MKKLFSVLLAVLFLAAALPSQVQPIVKTQTVELRIQAAPDFNMAVTPPSITTFVGRTVAYSVTLESVNDFAGEVMVGVSGLPADIKVTFFPSNVVTIASGPLKGIQVNLEIPATATVGTLQVTVTATSDKYN
jgi:uncharacterized membrane protein